MRVHVIATACILLLTAGCATNRLDERLTGLLGYNIEAAVSRLGHPDGKRTVMDDTIYTWSSSRNTSLPLTTTNTTMDMVGNTPVYGTTTATNWVPANFNCTIQIATNSAGSIKSYQWSGNESGCRRYADGMSSIGG